LIVFLSNLFLKLTVVLAIVKPFKALRPSRDKVALVSSKSYEAYTPAELGAKLDFNPFTFLHIIHPGYKHPQETSSEHRFQMVHDSYKEFKENGIFIKEDIASFYVYESSDSLDSFCGIIAATAVDDYTNGHIKKHEGTIKKREQLFETYLKATGFNAEPVLLMYEDDVAFDDLLLTIKKERPEYEFSTTDKRLHRLWLVQDFENIEKITSFSAQVSRLQNQLIRSRMLRLGVFIALVFGLYFFFENTKAIGVVLLFGIALFLFLITRHQVIKYKRDLLLQLIAINKKELKILNRDFHEFETGNQYQDPTHSYSHDIDFCGVWQFFSIRQ